MCRYCFSSIPLPRRLLPWYGCHCQDWYGHPCLPPVGGGTFPAGRSPQRVTHAKLSHVSESLSGSCLILMRFHIKSRLLSCIIRFCYLYVDVNNLFLDLSLSHNNRFYLSNITTHPTIAIFGCDLHVLLALFVFPLRIGSTPAMYLLLFFSLPALSFISCLLVLCIALLLLFANYNDRYPLLQILGRRNHNVRHDALNDHPNM